MIHFRYYPNFASLPAGFKGQYCEIEAVCERVDCLNGGTCQSTDGSDYTCQCLEGFAGAHCEVSFEGIVGAHCEVSFEGFAGAHCEVSFEGFAGAHCEVSFERLLL